ncbi:MAG: phosphotransferase enzyme family protein [Terracidiphilus sp.]
MTASAKAHGMDGTLVAPDWPPLRLDEVRELLRQFPGRLEPIEILSVSPRPFSAASVVKTNGKRVFVKRHHQSVRDREGLLEEHRFLDYLRSRCADVPRVLSSGSGESAIELGEWTYEVHEPPAGIDLYEDAISWTPFKSVHHACSAGQMLARLHLASEGFNAPRRKQRPLVASFTIFGARDASAEMNRYLAARPALEQYFQRGSSLDEALELLTPFHAELLPLIPNLAPLWTHNDLHGSNFFWSDATEGARAVAIIDFGLADRTNAVHDMAQAIERNIVEWLTLVNDPAHPEAVTVHFDHLHALLEGYEQVRPLSDEEAAALAPMTALCHAEFALSETDYFLSVLHSEEKASMAAEGWLVGHARWFHRAAGRKLLDALRRWADARKSSTLGATRS